MLLIKKANQTCRKCIHHFKLAAGRLAGWRSCIQTAAAAARSHGGGGRGSQVRRWNQQESGRHRGRKVKAGAEGEGYVKAFHSLARLPRVAPASPSSPLPSVNLSSPAPAESGPLCRAVGELTFHRLPSAALIISPAGVTARGLRWRGSRKLLAKEVM